MPNLRLVSLDRLKRQETDNVKRRLQGLETQDPAINFTGPLTATWLDYPLADTTNGNVFADNTASYPAGWTQATAPQATATNNPYGFWLLNGSAGTGAWKFRYQSPFTIESLAANAYKSFHVGPLIIKDCLPTADLNYYFGIYRNNAGSIDENTFVRLNINWLTASSLWQIRAERKDGTTQTNGTYYTLARVPLMPLWLRLVVTNTTNKDVLAYFGPTRFANMQMQLLSGQQGSGITWGQVWWQFHMSRGTGPDDRVLIGGIDYSSDV